MEDLLELTKKSYELTILSNSKSNTRRMERGTKNLRWCNPWVAGGYRCNIAWYWPFSIADDDDPQHTAKRLLKMHTNRYENRKAKELNLERIFRKQAQPHSPTSSQSTQHSLCSIALRVIQTGPHFPPQQFPHTHIILSTSSRKLSLPQQGVFLITYLCFPHKSWFYFLVQITVLQLLYYISYYNLKFW
jgi:hypothetical protein